MSRVTFPARVRLSSAVPLFQSVENMGFTPGELAGSEDLLVSKSGELAGSKKLFVLSEQNSLDHIIISSCSEFLREF